MSKESFRNLSEAISENRIRLAAVSTGIIFAFLGINQAVGSDPAPVKPEHASCSAKTNPFSVKPGMGYMHILTAIEGVGYPTSNQMLLEGAQYPYETKFQQTALDETAKMNGFDNVSELIGDEQDINLPKYCIDLGGMNTANLDTANLDD